MSRRAGDASASSARCRGSRSPRCGRRRSDATRPRRLTCAPSRAGCRTPFRASSARMRRQAGSRWTISRPRTIRCGRRSFWPASWSLDFAAAVGRDLAIIHARSAADPTIPAAFANDETFEAIRIEPYLRATGRAHPSSRRASRSSRRRRSRRSALWFTATSARRTSFKGPDGPGVPRRRMRLVRRSRLRSRLLSQPSSAQGRARRRRQDALHRRVFGAGGRLSRRRRLGERDGESKRARPPCCRLCSSPGSTASRRSNTSPARASAPPCAAAPNRWSPIRRLASRTSPTHGATRHERTRHPIARRAAHLGLARPPDGRSGNHAERRRDRPGHCAGRRIARFA